MIEAVLVLTFIAPSWIFALYYWYFAARPRLRSESLKTLNFNLAKVGMFWSNADGNFRPLGPESVARDGQRMLRSFLIMTSLLSVFSIVGMILLILIFVSGHPRLERNTFASALTQQTDLTAEQVSQIVAELQSTI